MYLIAGLGNPGSEYDKTRHNAGFDTIDVLALRHGIEVKKAAHKALVGKGVIAGQKVILVKPQTYMNNSGVSLIEICNYYGIEPEEVIIISDDVTLDCGKIRVRRKGSAGGHNGLKSIIEWLDTQDIPRVRVGVGKLPEHGDMIKHVLGHFTDSDRKLMEEGFEAAASAVEEIITAGIDSAMNKFN